MIELPLVVEMSVDTSKKVYQFNIEQTCETYQMTQDTVFNVNIVDAPRYEGDYVVTPLAHSQTVLETKDKLLEDNVTVLKIPTSETHNQYGITFYIAEV